MKTAPSKIHDIRHNKICITACIFLVIGFFFFNAMKAPGNFIIAGAVITLFAQSLQRFTTLPQRPSFWGAIFLLFILLLSGILSPFPLHLHDIGSFIYRIVVFVLLLAFVIQQQWKDRLILTFIIGSTVASILFSINNAGINLAPDHHVIGISFVHSIQAASLIAIASYFCLYQIFIRHWKAPQWFYLLCLLIMLVFLLYFNKERTGLTTLAGLAILFMFQRLSLKQSLAWLIIIVAIGIAAFEFSPRVHEYFGDAMTNGLGYIHALRNNDTKALEQYGTTSVGQRLDILYKSQHLVAQRPLLGFGVGHFADAYKTLKDKDMMRSGRGYAIGDPDDTYLEWLVQTGIFGVFAMLMFYFLVYRDAKKHLNTKYFHYVCGILIAYLIGSLTESTLSNFKMGLFFFAMLGILLSHEIKKPQHQSAP